MQLYDQGFTPKKRRKIASVFRLKEKVVGSKKIYLIYLKDISKTFSFIDSETKS